MAALGTTATAVFLDEYTPAGVFVQSIPLPTTGTTSLTAVGNATTEGFVTLSQDGSSLIFTGYRKDAGGTNPSSDTPATTNRVIASVGISGVVNTSVALTDPTGTIRSATTVNGTSFYVGLSSGVRYVASPGAASTSLQIDNRNSREVLLVDNTLYASNGSTAITAKIQSYGPLPTTATTATPLINLATGDAVNGISLFDLSPTVPGIDTIYALSTVENQLRKFTLDLGGSWALSGSTSAASAQNLTGFASGETVNLFLTTGAALRPFTDATGYNGSIDGLALDAAIASAATNTAFRGVGLIPVPEPTTGILCGLVMVAAFGTRRSRV